MKEGINKFSLVGKKSAKGYSTLYIASDLFDPNSVRGLDLMYREKGVNDERGDMVGI